MVVYFKKQNTAVFTNASYMLCEENDNANISAAEAS
jgi:hypothetical protein